MHCQYEILEDRYLSKNNNKERLSVSAVKLSLKIRNFILYDTKVVVCQKQKKDIYDSKVVDARHMESKEKTTKLSYDI